MISNALKKEKENLAAKAAVRDFMSKNFVIKVVLIWVLYPVSVLISCFMSGSHVYINFEQVFNHGGLSLFLAIMLVVTIEAGKYFFADSAIDDAFDGVTSGTGNEQLLFVMKLIGAILFFGGSIYLNLSGAPLAAEHFKKKADPVQLVSIDSINQRYDALVASEAAGLSQVSNMTYKGRITREGQSIAKQISRNKEGIEKNRASEIALAVSENEKRTKEWQEKLSHSGYWFVNFAGVFEVIQLICLFFIAVYNDGAKETLKKGASASSTPGSAAAASAASPTPSGGGIDMQEIMLMLNRAIDTKLAGLTAHSPAEPPVKEMREIGFHRHEPGKIDESTGLHSEEKLQLVATDVIDIEILNMALKDATKNLKAWQAKLEGGIGTPDTNKDHITKWEKRVEEIQSLIDENA